MPLWGRMGSMFLSDEELGKKNDDHKPTKLPTIRPQQQWAPSRPSPRQTLKRLAVVFLVVIIIYLFVHNISTDVPIRDRRRPIYQHGDGEALESLQNSAAEEAERAAAAEPSCAPGARRSSRTILMTGRSSFGPCRFLYEIGGTGGCHPTNRNILFAASSLQSAAALLQVACRWALKREL